MPELKNTFTGGKMEKDQDERIVPSGLYREALNVTVSTSEDSDVGAAQNILGNIKVTEAISGPNNRYTNIDNASTCGFDPFTSLDGRYFLTNTHIAAVVDVETDMMYRLISTAPTSERPHGVWMDRIVEYDTTGRKEVLWYKKEKSVLVDIYKVETSILSVQSDENCNKTIIRVCRNSFQLRTGLRIMGSGISADALVHIEDISYSGTVATVTLSEDITAILMGVSNISFHGDRNLNFSVDRKITGVNIIDGMLFWTDNHSEPKKINLERCKRGSDTQLWSNMDEVKLYGNWGTIDDAAYSDFDQHTLLIVDDEAVIECNKVESTCPSPGCRDPLALNYDPTATSSCLGCCEYQELISGCTDPNACNYDPSAGIDDELCEYLSECECCHNGVIYDVTVLASPCYSADHPCNILHTCFLAHYGSTGGDGDDYVQDMQGNTTPACGGTWTTAKGLEFMALPTQSQFAFPKFWYWETGTLTDLGIGTPFYDQGYCVYPLTGPNSFGGTDLTSPILLGTPCPTHTHAIKRMMPLWKLQMDVGGVWYDHVHFVNGPALVGQGYQGSTNPSTAAWMNWMSVLEVLQAEGFDGTTLDFSGTAFPLVLLSDTLGDVVAKILGPPGGYQVATSTGPFDKLSTFGTRDLMIPAGSFVKYRIVENNPLIDAENYSNSHKYAYCSGWIEADCYPHPTGKFSSYATCIDGDCNERDGELFPYSSLGDPFGLYQPDLLDSPAPPPISNLNPRP